MENFTPLDGKVHKVGTGEYQLIKVNSPQSFVRAVQIYEQIETEMEILSLEAEKLGTTPNCRPCEDLLTKQAIEINNFRDSVNVYDSKYLSDNLMKLTEAAGLRFSDVDDMLGVSTGYIAKTVKKDSKKRLSIDIVRNLAELFHVNIDDLISRPLYGTSKDMETMIKFLEMLRQKTRSGDYVWRRLDKHDIEYKALFREREGSPRYRFKPKNDDTSFFLKEVYYEKIKDGALFVTYHTSEEGRERCEVLRANSACFYSDGCIRTPQEIETTDFLEVCDSADDPNGILKEKIKEIINAINSRERDYKIEFGAKQFITEFMGEEDD
ncbi:MAG: helix-turn-helix transcriptional regulator [Lachnospiraceae bacterium]|nr:helix-turn-helix transcriptional regulator [Lachnospiraceae bacterium]